MLIVVCLAFFRAGSENLPTCVFQVRFSSRKHGVRGNECQKRSVVSVWYAQNSLPFCTEVWYTTLMSCEDPAKMLMRVCTLLPMQPAPLTGTATDAAALPLVPDGCSPYPSRGQQHYQVAHLFQDAPMQPAPLTGTKKRETRNNSVSCLPFYISACSLTSLFHIDEEGYAGILCHSPCAAGFRCVLRGRRQLVYILSLYLSYVK